MNIIVKWIRCNNLYLDPTYSTLGAMDVNLDAITMGLTTSIAVLVAPKYRRIFLQRPRIGPMGTMSSSVLFRLTTPTLLTSVFSAHVCQTICVQVNLLNISFYTEIVLSKLSVSLYLDEFKKEFPDGEIKTEIIENIQKIKSQNKPIESIYESIKYRTSGGYKFEESNPKNVEVKERDFTSSLETKNKADDSLQDLMAYLEAKNKSNKPK